MAKEKKEGEEPKKLSFADFEEDENFVYEQEEEESEDETEEDESEEEEEEIVEEKKPKGKAKPKKAKDEEESEEEEEEKPKGKKKVTAKKEEEEELEEEEQEEEEQEEETDEDETDNSETASKFFEEVEKITGTELEVDYKDVDPLSPQGVALRETALKEVVINNFFEELEQKFPQLYQALEHANNGGDVTELFSQTTSRDYSKVEIKEGDEALAKEILKEYYKAKGVKTDSRVAKLLEVAEDSDEGLVKEAQSALEELRAEQEEERSEIMETQRKKSEERKKKDSLLVTAIDEVLETRKLGNFKILDKAEARQFKEYVVKSLRRTGDDKYEFTAPVDSNALESSLQYLFFQFKKGDLSKIIQRKAVTENVKKLKLRMDAEQSKVKKNAKEERNSKLSLNDFWAS